jgi:hypothetical protein
MARTILLIQLCGLITALWIIAFSDHIGAVSQGGEGVCSGMDILVNYTYYSNCSIPPLDSETSSYSGGSIADALDDRYFSFEMWMTVPATDECDQLLNIDNKFIVQLYNGDNKTIQVRSQDNTLNVTFPPFSQPVFPGVLFISFHRYFWTASTLSENCSVWYTHTISKTVAPFNFGATTNTFSRFDRVVIDIPRMPPARTATQRCVTSDLAYAVDVNDTISIEKVADSSNSTLLSFVEATDEGADFKVGVSYPYCTIPDIEAATEEELAALPSVNLTSNSCRQIPTQVTARLCIAEPAIILTNHYTVEELVYIGQNRSVEFAFASSVYDEDLVLLSDAVSDYGTLHAGEDCLGSVLESEVTVLNAPYSICYETKKNMPLASVEVNDTFVFLANDSTPISLTFQVRPHLQAFDDTFGLVENASTSFDLRSFSWLNISLYHHRIAALPTSGVASVTQNGTSVKLGQLVLNSTLYYRPDPYFAGIDDGLKFVLEGCGGIITAPATVSFNVSGIYSGSDVVADDEVVVTLSESGLQVSDCVSITDFDDGAYNYTFAAHTSRGLYQVPGVCDSGCSSFQYSAKVADIMQLITSAFVDLEGSMVISGVDGMRIDIEGKPPFYCRYEELTTPTRAPTTLATSPGGMHVHEAASLGMMYALLALGLSVFLFWAVAKATGYLKSANRNKTPAPPVGLGAIKFAGNRRLPVRGLSY